jgi:hypothetical protein
MANPLERAATRRKVGYLAVIVGLFTVSLFWRGKIAFGKPDRADAASAVARTADRVSRLSVGEQAKQLELRELDQGEPEIAGTAMRLALTGSRGAAVTALWWTAIEKQKRNEWTQFENAARLVTRLQPNFVTPWIFQAWNIAYNVSVENDKLGDMFFYIARGIELLAEGDKLNSKVYVKDGREYKIGVPDMRYQIAFYYQNKFGVSDKVQTLRCLMQLAAMPPADRDPRALKRDDKLDPAAFRAFCEKNPQLVRRLRENVFVDTDQKNPYATPELVVQFLEDNYTVPTRYAGGRELKPKVEDRFPAFPPAYQEGPDEYKPDSPTDDTFDAFDAARGWFGYAIATSPPVKTGTDGRPLPWASPVAGEYDPFKYRMPRSPAYIIFRQAYPRSQTYLAERLQKEGWFDQTSSWNPDERADKLWFKKTPSDPDAQLKTRAGSREEWRRAFALWRKYADENAMTLDTPARLNLIELASKVPGDPGMLPQPGEWPPQRLAEYKITQDNIDAKKALIYYDQNRSMTNFPFFIASSEAEQDPLTVDARKLLYRAAMNKKYGSNAAAIRDYVAGLSLWRQALTKYPNFHRPERSESTEEETWEYEVELVKLLRGDGQVLARAGKAAAAAGALFPALTDLARQDYEQAVAEQDAGYRVIALDPEVQKAVRAEARKRAEKLAFGGHHAAIALVGVAAADSPGMADALTAGLDKAAAGGDLAREVMAEKFDWMREFVREPLKGAKGNYLPTEADYWVRPTSRDTVKLRQSQSRPSAAQQQPQQAPGSAAEQPATPGS